MCRFLTINCSQRQIYHFDHQAMITYSFDKKSSFSLLLSAHSATAYGNNRMHLHSIPRQFLAEITPVTPCSFRGKGVGVNTHIFLHGRNDDGRLDTFNEGLELAWSQTDFGLPDPVHVAESDGWEGEGREPEIHLSFCVVPVTCQKYLRNQISLSSFLSRKKVQEFSWRLHPYYGCLWIKIDVWL